MAQKGQENKCAIRLILFLSLWHNLFCFNVAFGFSTQNVVQKNKLKNPGGWAAENARKNPGCVAVTAAAGQDAVAGRILNHGVILPILLYRYPSPRPSPHRGVQVPVALLNTAAKLHHSMILSNTGSCLARVMTPLLEQFSVSVTPHPHIYRYCTPPRNVRSRRDTSTLP